MTTRGQIAGGVDSINLAGSGGSNLVGFLQAGTGAVARTVQGKERDIVSVKDFGATGDGVTDDTAAIQAALDSGAKIVTCKSSDTYLVSYVGTKTINGTANRYCLLIPDNVFFDLNGATLKLAAASNAALVLNSTAGTTQNLDLGIGNGTLDGNQVNQTAPGAGEMACVFFYNVMRPRVVNLKAQNVREYAGRFLNCDTGYFNNLSALDSNGDGWSFGTTGSAEFRMFRSFVDNIYAKDCTGVYGTLEGNGVIFTVVDCQIGKVSLENCAGGIKIQNSSQDSSFDELSFVGGALGSNNSGIKVQGDGASMYPTNIKINSITTRSCYGYSAYFYYCKGVQVGKISSNTDATNGSVEAVRVDATANGTKIGSVRVDEAGSLGLALNGVDTYISSATVSNSGNVTAGQANISMAATCNGLHIDHAISIDNQGTHTADRGINLIAGSKNITIDRYHSRGDYATPGSHLLDSATNFTLKSYFIDDNELYVPLYNVTQAGNDAASAAEKDLQSVTVKARSLWRNGLGYRIVAWGVTVSNTNPKTIKLYWGSGAIQTTALTVSQSSFWRIDAIVTKRASNVQPYNSLNIQPGTTNIFDMERGEGSQTDTSDIIVKTTATVTDGGGGINANDLICYGLTVTPLN